MALGNKTQKQPRYLRGVLWSQPLAQSLNTHLSIPGVLVISEPYPEGLHKSVTEGVTLGYMQNSIKGILSVHEGGLPVCPA